MKRKNKKYMKTCSKYFQRPLEASPHGNHVVFADGTWTTNKWGDGTILPPAK